ncbi:MAG: tyrosine-protein phosphatase [Spirochaetales bacterium]|nr:tyrosine-protein phosphatase [Spirochaetales bacterium]
MIIRTTPTTEKTVPHLLPEEEREKYRWLPFDKAFNFRDIGGYKTVEGKKVRWGLLYRSAVLRSLTADDRKYMDRLGIKYVVDFRSVNEKEKDGDKIDEGIDYKHMPIAAGGDDLQQKIQEFIHGKRELDIHLFMIDMYKEIIQNFSGIYREWLTGFLQAEKQLPQVFHCTAGKDRTGLGSAIILSILNVPQETIFEDYLLTNTCNQRINNKILSRIKLITLFRTKKGDISPLLMAHEDYLSTAFSEIDKIWGSFDNYCHAEDGLNLKDSDLKNFRDLFLE